ncbi:MAG: tRNA (adenosine(37)-N6)-threonylcarbamoyltransferase complex transferase subunit TsaD [Candidatus Dormibacteria bacterium]
MLTLGIETSCDETSAAVVEDGREILSNVVSSQVALHRDFGGVVPELAARSHVERLPAVVDAALETAGRGLDRIDLIAVTRGPGLVGALLAGVGFARALAWERGLPIVGVSHLDGHLHSAFLESPGVRLPLLVLIASGGHTELVLMDDNGEYRLLGRTLDDAAGEAFDKVARMLGLGYPGGPEIDRVAAGVSVIDAQKAFPLPRIHVDGLDFSFSGLKTAVRYGLDRAAGRRAGQRLDPGAGAMLDPGFVALAAASFQHRAVEHLRDQFQAAAATAVPAARTLALVGGVAMNSSLRAAVAAAAERVMGRRDALVLPGPTLCTDNAAMIAAAGHALHARGGGRSLAVDPSLRWGAT